MVQVTVGGGGELQGAETDIIKGLVIDTESLVRVLNQLMDGERGVVGLDNAQGTSERKDSEMYTRQRTSTTVSDTLGLGTTEYVHIILSGYSSLIFEIRSVPIPAPVPPPRECVIWKPRGWESGRAQRAGEIV